MAKVRSTLKRHIGRLWQMYLPKSADMPFYYMSAGQSAIANLSNTAASTTAEFLQNTKSRHTPSPQNPSPASSRGKQRSRQRNSVETPAKNLSRRNLRQWKREYGKPYSLTC